MREGFFTNGLRRIKDEISGVAEERKSLLAERNRIMADFHKLFPNVDMKMSSGAFQLSDYNGDNTVIRTMIERVIQIDKSLAELNK